MKEVGTLFVSGYLATFFYMLPLMGIYLFLGLKRIPTGGLLQFHKALVLLSIVMPVILVLISLSGSLKTDSGSVEETRQTQGLTRSEAIAPSGAETDGFSVEDPAAGRWPGIQDVVFYIVDYITLFSVLGALIFILRYGIQTRRLDTVKQDAVVSPIAQNCLLVESARIRWPFSVGYFRKSIFIPDGMPAWEKEAVIRHELNHFRFHHHLWSLLETLLACVFWFNPFAHVLRRRGIFLRELECDGRTVKSIDRYEYTRLLVKTAETMTEVKAHKRFSLLTQALAPKKELKIRVVKLLQNGPEKKNKALGVLVAAALAVTVSVTLIYGNQNDATQKKIFTEVNLEYSKRAPEAARIDIEKVPPHFISALLVHEDAGFYDHGGVRLKSVLRAAGKNLKSFISGSGLFRDGGSTITQQLAKQFIDDPRRSMKRKFRELRIARVLERNFSKDDILEMYLNMVYFGNNAYGLKAASKTYFVHDYSELTLNESAMLVPFITAPSRYNVLADPVAAQKRQLLLLKKLAAPRG